MSEQDDDGSGPVCLRDWFAATCGAPNIADAWDLIGRPANVCPPWKDILSWDAPATETRTSLKEWFYMLPLAERESIAAKLRYRQADAMLAARARRREPKP